MITDPTPEPALLAAATRLRAAMEEAATALSIPQLEALLASAAAIEGALAELPPFQTIDHDERRLVRLEVVRARSALLRCRRLGNGLRDFVRLSLEAQGRQTGYGRGAHVPALQTFTERV